MKQTFALLIVLGISFFPSFAQSTTYTFTSFDFPGAASTQPQGISNAGVVVGFWVDNANLFHGFTKNGSQFTSLDVPGSTSTSANGINSSGSVVGRFIDSAGKQHAFLLENGIYTTIDFPGGQNSLASGITEAGVIAGSFFDGSRVRGFFRMQDGTFQAFDFPNSSTTFVNALNNRMDVVGIGGDGTQAFLFSNGQGISIAPSNSCFSSGTGINDPRVIVGLFVAGTPPFSCSGRHGFIRSQNGAFTTIDAPSNPAAGTGLTGINDAGVLVGFAADSPQVFHGFIAMPAAQ